MRMLKRFMRTGWELLPLSPSESQATLIMILHLFSGVHTKGSQRTFTDVANYILQPFHSVLKISHLCCEATLNAVIQNYAPSQDGTWKPMTISKEKKVATQLQNFWTGTVCFSKVHTDHLWLFWLLSLTRLRIYIYWNNTLS